MRAWRTRPLVLSRSTNVRLCCGCSAHVDLVSFRLRNPSSISLALLSLLAQACYEFESVPRFLILDRDAKNGFEVPADVRTLKMSPVRTSFERPWQDGFAERRVSSCRPELLDHIIAIDEGHLERLLLYASATTTRTAGIRTRENEHQAAEVAP